MRTVSTSSRTTITNGKRVTTTETTTVGADGERHTKTETTVHNPDGTVTTTVTGGDDRIIHNNGNNIANAAAKDASNKYGQNDSQNENAESIDNILSNMIHQPMARKQPEVTAIVPECRLGVTVSNVETEDHGETIVSIRVGPVEIALGDSYDIVEDDGTKEISSGNDNNKGKQNDHITSLRGGFPPAMMEKFKVTMERTASSMKKNAEALGDELKDDFPSRAVKAGEKVINNFGKTFDRASKLASDLYKMWSSKDD